jgi:hypothetical protein
MNNQPENKPEANTEPRIIVPGNFPIRDSHKARIKYPPPPWWPRTNAKRLELGHRVADAINSIATELAYQISNNLVANLRTQLILIENLQNWRTSAKSLLNQYTDINDFLFEGSGFVGEPNHVIILKLDANAVATLGPVTANIECFSGLLGILIAIENELKTVDAYNANQNFGIRLGFITVVPEKTDLTHEIFHITGDTQIDGQPAVKWTKGTSNGAVFNFRETDGDDTHWHPAGTYLNTPSVLAIPQHAKPRVVEIQARYLKGNHQIGALSAPYQLTIPAANE